VEGGFACASCCCSFANRAGLRQHVIQKHGLRSWKSEPTPSPEKKADSSVSFPVLNRLLTIFRAHSILVFLCELLQSTPAKTAPPVEETIQESKKVKEYESSYKCSKCPFITPSKTMFERHSMVIK
jgi:hypothetical protein